MIAYVGRVMKQEMMEMNVKPHMWGLTCAHSDHLSETDTFPHYRKESCLSFHVVP